jgi:hypothetical protein
VNLNPIVYENLEPIRIPVTIGKTQYELRECGEAGAIVVKQAALNGTEVVMEDGTENRIIRKLAGSAAVNATLVSECLYENIGPEEGAIIDRWRKMSLLRVQALSPKIIRQLAERANEISEIDAPDDLATLKKERDRLNIRIAKLEAEQPKNEQSAGATTSS